MASANGLFTSEDDDLRRCTWCAGHSDYCAYHDAEWGHPVADDQHLFEKVCLEGFQSGLSWLTILRKRENFRDAFDGFDVNRIARYSNKKVDRLLTNEGIIRHRGKVESTVNNARRAIELKKEFGTLAAYFWQFEPASAERPRRVTRRTVGGLSKTTASTAMARDLKKRGWSFVGPTTAYAFMQSMGMVNDHYEGCHCRDTVERLRNAFERPSVS